MDHRDRRHRAALEAAEWLLRLQDQRVPRSERAEYVRWLRESPLHVAEILRVSRVHGELTDFPYWNEIAPLDASSSGASVHELSLAREPPIRESRPVRSLRFWVYISALAAGIAILGVALVYFGDFRYQTIDTGAGERRTVTLADGSVVRASPESSLRVHFTKNERRVTLSRGNALFRVAKDPAKPFLVETNRTRVRAVGTAFGVEYHYDSIIVTVEEGRVAVAQAPMDPSRSVARTLPVAEISLNAGQQIIVPQVGSMGQVRKVDSRRELAWADGHLVFDHDSVAEVVQQFNRFNRVQIKVLDPQLAARPVSAVFNVSDPEAFVTFLEAVANIRVTHPSRNMIVIASGGT
jgi:transmembrane sensor